ncbi:MAG: hypothetical protein AB1724_17665 [Thermodesulfobacteriota bacterium]
MKHYKRLFVLAMIALLAIPAGAAGNTLSSALDSINVHGFVSQGFLNTTKDTEFLLKDSNKGSFQFNEMAVNFSASPSSDLTLGMQLFAYDLGENGNDEVKVDWAYGNYALHDYLNVQAGIMKMPHGLYNETRDIDMVRTSILMPTSVYPEWFRDAMARIKGAGLHGNLPGNITYKTLYGYIDVAEESGMTDGIETLINNLGVDTDDTDTENSSYATQLVWDSPFGLRLGATLSRLDNLTLDMSSDIPIPAMATGGLSGLTTPLNALMEFEPIDIYVLSAEYMFDRLTLATEYCEYDIDYTIYLTTLLDPAISGAMGIPPTLSDKATMQGFYGSAAYRLLDPLEIGFYYSELYWDKDDHNGHDYARETGKPSWGAWLKDKCLSVRYDFTANWCAKVEGHLMDGSFMAYTKANRNWSLYAAKVTYNF